MQDGALPERWAACAKWLLIEQIPVASVACLPRLCARELCEGGEVRGQEGTSSAQATGKQGCSCCPSLWWPQCLLCLILPVYNLFLSYASLRSWTGGFNRDAAVPAESLQFVLLIFGSWRTMRALKSHKVCWKGQIAVYSGKASSFFPTVPSPSPCHPQAIKVLTTCEERISTHWWRYHAKLKYLYKNHFY